MDEKRPSEAISDFLNFVDYACKAYKTAYDNVSKEDKRLQDYVHAIEFAEDKAERNRTATALQHSRRYRREEKDKTLLLTKEGEVMPLKITKERLKRYRKLISDISALESEISEMENGNGCSGDVVMDYSTGQGIPQGIYGFDWQRYERKKAQLEKKQQEAKKISDWIEAIEDGQTRIVFRLRYIDGCSWLKIAKKIGMPHREDYIRIVLHDRFFEK